MCWGRLSLIAGLLLAGVVPTQAWMTFVGRNVDTGERLGLGARVANADADPALAILCTPDGLTATFDTGYVVPPDAVLDELPEALLVAADGGAFHPFPALLEPFNRGERIEMRLRLEASEAMGLAENVLSADETITIRYDLGDEAVVISFSNDSAMISLGAVLGECEGRGQAKTKG